MCLLVIAWNTHPRYRLVVAANRDEFHDRPTAPMAKWPPPNDILAGRDLRANGTWLALDRRRRFGVITNFRDLQRAQPQAPSRGELIPRYLGAQSTPAAFLSALEPDAGAYAGFNLLLADEQSLWYACNRTDPLAQNEGSPPPSQINASAARTLRPGAATSAQNPFARALPPGVYGLSNQFLDTPWPKLRRVRREFATWLARPAGSADELFAILDDRTVVEADEELPRTGLSMEWERILSAPFVLHPDYGTRCSTVLLLEHSGACVLIERRFDRLGQGSGESHWILNPTDWP
jgi:uncharacterized protein with NRDE domain